MKLYWKHAKKEVLGSDGATYRAKIERLPGRRFMAWIRNSAAGEWIYLDQFFTLDAAMRALESAKA